MRLNRDQYFLELVKLVARRSTCGRRQVGAIITDVDGKVLSIGYNGVPAHLRHCTDSPCPGVTDPSGNTDRCEAVHAEVNAILQCENLRVASCIYVSCTPCFSCAKMIANTSIDRVICLEAYADTRGAEILRRAHVEIILAKV